MKKLSIPVKFPKNLKDLRHQAGASQKELGQLTGYGQNHISYWEHGKTFPGIEALMVLSNQFQVSIDSLLFHPEFPGHKKECNATCLAYKQISVAEKILDNAEMIKWRRIRTKIRDLMCIKDTERRNIYLGMLELITDDIYKLAREHIMDNQIVVHY